MKLAINFEEKIGKTVGRRLSPIAPFKTHPTDIDESKKWRSAFGGVGIRKGVYRFKTHEEADAANMAQIIQQRAARWTKT